MKKEKEKPNRTMSGPISDTAENIANRHKGGRPEIRILNIGATPEYAARAIFAAADAKIKKGSAEKNKGSD